MSLKDLSLDQISHEVIVEFLHCFPTSPLSLLYVVDVQLFTRVSQMDCCSSGNLTIDALPSIKTITNGVLSRKTSFSWIGRCGFSMPIFANNVIISPRNSEISVVPWSASTMYSLRVAMVLAKSSLSKAFSSSSSAIFLNRVYHCQQVLIRRDCSLPQGSHYAAHRSHYQA